MKIRHRNSDRGWSFTGTKPKREEAVNTRDVRAAFKEFAKRHKVPYGKWGRLEVEE